MFDELVEAVSVMLKAVAKENASKLFAFTAIARVPHTTKFTIISDGEMYMVTVSKVEQ